MYSQRESSAVIVSTMARMNDDSVSIKFPSPSRITFNLQSRINMDGNRMVSLGCQLGYIAETACVRMHIVCMLAV